MLHRAGWHERLYEAGAPYPGAGGHRAAPTEFLLRAFVSLCFRNLPGPPPFVPLCVFVSFVVFSSAPRSPAATFDRSPEGPAPRPPPASPTATRCTPPTAALHPVPAIEGVQGDAEMGVGVLHYSTGPPPAPQRPRSRPAPPARSAPGPRPGLALLPPAAGQRPQPAQEPAGRPPGDEHPAPAPDEPRHHVIMRQRLAGRALRQLIQPPPASARQWATTGSWRRRPPRRAHLGAQVHERHVEGAGRVRRQQPPGQVPQPALHDRAGRVAPYGAQPRQNPAAVAVQRRRGQRRRPGWPWRRPCIRRSRAGRAAPPRRRAASRRAAAPRGLAAACRFRARA